MLFLLSGIWTSAGKEPIMNFVILMNVFLLLLFNMEYASFGLGMHNRPPGSEFLWVSAMASVA